LRGVDLQKFTDVSDELTASIITDDHRCDDTGSKHVSNDDKLLPDYTAQHKRRQLSSDKQLDRRRAMSDHLMTQQISTDTILGRKKKEMDRSFRSLLELQ
jgi:hypothetical protein